MPENTKLHAYAVALVFDTTGPLIANTIISPAPEAAAAKMVEDVMRALKPEQTLTGVAVVELSLEWLRTAVQAIQSGSMEGARVLSIVPQAAPGERDDASAPGPWSQAVSQAADPGNDRSGVAPRTPPDTEPAA